MTVPAGQDGHRAVRRARLAERGLTLWANVAVGGFYRRVHLLGDRALPQGRPAVIAINHSNALGDIALLLHVDPQFPRFLAASSWWRRAPARLLFRLGGVLPLDRPGNGSPGRHNGATFAACHDALAAAEHIAIFPEGVLNTGAELLPFHTGAARIALSAAIDAGIRGIVLVPVALAYEDRGRLRSDVVIRLGEPVEMDDLVEAGRAHPIGTVRGVTELLQSRLAASLALASSELEVRAVARTVGPRPKMTELVLLTPIAVAGVVANASAILPIALGAQFVRHEGWQATAKAVGATFLLPVSWIMTGRILARRWGPVRAGVLVSAGAGSGWITLVWLGRMRDLSTLGVGRAASKPT